jgi:hypothetical protein
MAAGNRRIVQEDFSAGAFPATSFENIPGNGVVDAVNLLVDDDRSLKMRGGSRWAAPALGAGSTITWMWSGTIGSIPSIILANPSRLSASNDVTVATINTAGASPSVGPGVSLASLLFLPGGVTLGPALAVGAAALVRDHYAVAGNRLWAAAAGSTRVDFSDVGVPGTFGATSFHQIPEGGVLGMMGLRDAVVIFTTMGVWIISNVGMNLTDATGNVQHRIDRYSRDLILWNANGLGAAYEGGLVVPARDGVYLLNYGVASEAPQQFTLISRPIANLYRSYVDAGYIPGQPAVHRGSLFLPIRTTTGDFIDLLACRLDMTDASGARAFPWTRILHNGTSPLSLARSAISGNLVGGGVGDDRLMALDYFNPSVVHTDADGSTYGIDVQTRNPIRPTDVATVAKFRLGYELNGPVDSFISAGYQERPNTAAPVDGFAYPNWPGLDPYMWRVGQQASRSSIELDYEGAATRLVIRSFEWFVRDRGRV